MKFNNINLESIPNSLILNQALMETKLKSNELSDKYGFVFHDATDDISSLKICAIQTHSGNYYLLICREELPEQQTSIITSQTHLDFEKYIQERIEDFVTETGFNPLAIQQIWDFVQLKGSRPA